MSNAGTTPHHTALRQKPAFVLTMLLLVYVFNFIDRQILGILAGPIMADLHLDKFQYGLLSGLAFAILYTTMGVPLAWLADRRGRKAVVAVSLAVWSGFTALCGMAGSFGAMFLCRLGVGVGEAGGVAPSYALIAQVFPPERRARALAIYSLGIPIGSALGFLLGGYIAQHVNWRAAFISIGLAGVLFTPIFAMAVREPAADTPVQAQAKPSFGAVFAILARKRAFWLLSFGAGAGSMMGYGLAVWLPSVIQKAFGLDLVQTGQFFGFLLLTGGVIGVLAGGYVGDWLGQRNRAAYALMPALAYAAGMPFFIAGQFVSSAPVAFALFILPQALVYLWLGPVLTAVQHLVPAPMRATASASFLLINNLIGVGLGAPFIGLLADRLTPAYGADALRYAITLGLSCYLLAAALMALASRYLTREWVD